MAHFKKQYLGQPVSLLDKHKNVYLCSGSVSKDIKCEKKRTHYPDR